MSENGIKDLQSNQSYWLEIAATDENLHLHEKLLVREEHSNSDQINITHISKRDWKTGWLVYSYFSVMNTSMVIQEEEFTLISRDTWFSTNVVVGIFVLISMVTSCAFTLIFLPALLSRFEIGGPRAES